jgi:hypothetical protein
LLLGGRGDEAIALLERTVADAASLQLYAGQSLRLARLAQARAASGRDLKEAREIGSRAVQLAAQHGEHSFRARSLRVQAEIAMQIGDFDAAALQLEEALAIGTRNEMAPFVARCHLDLAVLRSHAGDRVAGEHALATAAAMLRELEIPSWRARADSLSLATIPQGIWSLE